MHQNVKHQKIWGQGEGDQQGVIGHSAIEEEMGKQGDFNWIGERLQNTKND